MHQKQINTERIKTVGELIAALQTIPPEVALCGSRPNGHDEYDCEVRPFCIGRYYNGIDNDVGICYVGIDYKHPN
jgi:hypothetical protein